MATRCSRPLAVQFAPWRLNNVVAKLSAEDLSSAPPSVDALDMMDGQVVIDRRFHGPPESANGGYVCGLMAGLIGPAGQGVEVTLRKPPPLETPLDVERRDGGQVVLLEGQTVVAEAHPASVEIDVPEPVTFDEAVAASKSYLGFQQHPFPTCFVCGPKRAKGEGLRIFAGNVPARDIVAAPWTPAEWLAGADAMVRPEFLWAALDCSGGIAFFPQLQGRSGVLGRIAAKLISPVRAGERLVAIGWRMGEERRKMYAGSALFSEDGDLRGFARATWIRLT
jgi:hypothetical protein